MSTENYFETTRKSEAKKKLKKMIKTHIIYDVGKNGKNYFIVWLDKDQFYKDSVETQADMDWYLDFLLKKF